MKKLLALLLAFAMIFAMAACGSQPAAGGDTAEKTWEDELGTKGLLRVGMAADYPPYESYDANGNVVGLDPDFAELMADYLGVELEIVPMSFDTIVSAVAAGTVDMGLSCFSYTEERAAAVLFTDTYMTSTQVCFASTQHGINSLEDLKGGLVAAGNGTTGYYLMEELAPTYGYDYQTSEIAIMAEALKAGTLQAGITEQCVADSYIAANPGDFKIIANDMTVEEIKAIANFNSPKLVEKINEFLADFVGSDAYDELLVKWFEQELE